MSRWTRERFGVAPERLARSLIGALLLRRLDDGVEVGGMIVETEAYLGVKDAAAHSYGGRRTARVASMYGQAGTAYVYFTYGMHHCFNVVCGEVDEPVAVLIRALEPRVGVERMLSLREGDGRRKSPVRLTEIASGPARLAQAMAIDRSLDGLDLVSDERLWIEDTSAPPRLRVRRSARVGVAYAGAWAARPLRWTVVGHPHVSRAPAGG